MSGNCICSKEYYSLRCFAHGWHPTTESAMETTLRKLVFAARTSGGTAGRDEALCQACDEAEALLERAASPPSVSPEPE